MNKIEYVIPLPKYGINCIDDSLIADPEAAEGTKNISFKNGIPQTRAGYEKHLPYELPAQPGTLVNFIQGTTRFLLAAAGTTLKRLLDTEAVDITGGTIASDSISTLTYPFKFADPDVYSDKLFILDGSTYRYYDGIQILAVAPYTPSTEEQSAYGTNVLSTNPDEIKKQRFILNDDERVWVAGAGKEVRISHLQRPDYFPSTQVWKLRENCTGMARYIGEVVLFTENTATLIAGSTPNWNLPEKYIYKELPIGYGCSNNKTITIGNNALYWANKNGVYRYIYLPTGFSIPECVSEFEYTIGPERFMRSVKNYIDKIQDWSKVYAVFFDNEYRLYMGEGKWLIFNTINSTWAYYEYDKGFTAAMIYDNKLYAAGPYLYQLDYKYDPNGVTFKGLSDDGAPIEYVLKSCFFDLGEPAKLKRFNEMIFTLYSELISYDIELILNLDNNYRTVQGQISNLVSRWGTFKFGDRITSKNTNLNYPITIEHKDKKYNIQYEMRCNMPNAAFILKAIVLKLKMRE